MFDNKIVVKKLNEVLTQLKEVFSDDQIEFLQSYINAGEWNLALETLCDILIEEEIPIDSRGYELLQEVGNTLNMEKETQQWSITIYLT
ncbi:MafI family immunity protein [Microcoleus sp. PH2017_05_CCC_O_A]|uniref:MafI family immunity protein n=1 Tax=Microcoleus sp. PH2017_05_CCC_O_A TaxID=2798816 RepID=UPI001DC28102|nr:MafI family immunity protein [Microcoleus sp. PH2017_05_CCC_O_A]MCC3439942.1 MafI family immunity protein [Microcoleus sp. PH2017_05_CCC_O_A]